MPESIMAPWDLWIPSAEYLTAPWKGPAWIIRGLMKWGNKQFPPGASRGQFRGPIARWFPGFFDLPHDQAFDAQLAQFLGANGPGGSLAIHGLADELLAYLSDPTALRIDVDDVHRLDLVYILATGERQPKAYARRWIDLTNQLAYHHVFYLYRDQKPGQGLARGLLKGAISAYGKLGVSRVELVAGFSEGGALWPQYGFRPKAYARASGAINML